MTLTDAINKLNSLPPNRVREAATYYYDAAGADWDGRNVWILYPGGWYRHSDALTYGLARYLARNP